MFAEQALAESETRFRALVTASSDVVYRMSADFGELRQLEGRHVRRRRSPHPTATGSSEYIHPDDRERRACAIRDAINRKRMFEIECRVFLADGSVGWTHARAVPMLDANGEITEWIGMASDITARKRAEQDTRQPAAHVRSHSHQHARPRLRLESANIASSTRTKACCACGAAPGTKRSARTAWNSVMSPGTPPCTIARSTRSSPRKQPVRGEVPFNGAFGRRYL